MGSILTMSRVDCRFPAGQFQFPTNGYLPASYPNSQTIPAGYTMQVPPETVNYTTNSDVILKTTEEVDLGELLLLHFTSSSSYCYANVLAVCAACM